SVVGFCGGGWGGCDGGKSGCACVGRRKGVAEKTALVWICCVVCGEQSVRQRAQWDAVVKESVAGTHYRCARDERRPGETYARGGVVVVSVDGAKPLEIVSEAGIESEGSSDLPLVLRVEAEVRIGLLDSGSAEVLGVALRVVGSGEETRQR